MHIYFDNLYALSVQYRYNTKTNVKDGQRTLYKKVKKQNKQKKKHTYGSLRPKELCNKSLIMLLSVKDSSMEIVLFMC